MFRVSGIPDNVQSEAKREPARGVISGEQGVSNIRWLIGREIFQILSNCDVLDIVCRVKRGVSSANTAVFSVSFLSW